MGNELRGLKMYGPCPVCKEMFESKRQKIYCSYECYLKSDQFKELAAKQRTGTYEKCRECGKEFYKKKGATRYYCSRMCYRKYMAKRFDRWIASPEEIALPHNYDEFLTSEELPCLVKGCTWRGKWLSLHMNFAHGVKARDFKKMAGFNLQSGIISLPLYEQMCARPHIKDAKFPENMKRGRGKGEKREYQSLERSEHFKKSFIINTISKPIIGTTKCLNCGNDMPIKFGGWNKRFCGIPCREEYYKKHVKERLGVKAVCEVCSKEFHSSPDQARRVKKGLPVTCSLHCRQVLNTPKGVGSHSGWDTVKNAKRCVNDKWK